MPLKYVSLFEKKNIILRSNHAHPIKEMLRVCNIAFDPVYSVGNGFNIISFLWPRLDNEAARGELQGKYLGISARPLDKHSFRKARPSLNMVKGTKNARNQNLQRNEPAIEKLRPSKVRVGVLCGK